MSTKSIIKYSLLISINPKGLDNEVASTIIDSEVGVLTVIR
jgi:hypothetical protein